MLSKLYNYIAIIFSASLVMASAAAPVMSDSLQGKKLSAIWCSSCHQIGPEIPTQGIGPPFHELGNQPRYTRDYLKGWITIPHSRMPHFLLSKDKLDDITDYILSLKSDTDATNRKTNTLPPLVRYARASGFYVSERGHVLTTAKLTNECKHITIRHSGEMLEREAKEVSSDQVSDLALLKTDITPSSFAHFTSTPISKAGVRVVSFGYPVSGMFSNIGTMSIGYVTALTGPRDNQVEFQMSTNLEFGSAGGPVVDASGRVVGIAIWSFGGNFAIRSSFAETMLSGAKILPNFDAIGNELGNDELAALLRGYTVHVTCWR